MFNYNIFINNGVKAFGTEGKIPTSTSRAAPRPLPHRRPTPLAAAAIRPEAAAAREAIPRIKSNPNRAF